MLFLKPVGLKGYKFFKAIIHIFGKKNQGIKNYSADTPAFKYCLISSPDGASKSCR